MEFLAVLRRGLGSPQLTRGSTKDDTEHVLMACPTYDEERRKLADALGPPIDATSLVRIVTESGENWAHLRKFMKDRADRERLRDKDVHQEKLWVLREEAGRREAKRKA